MSAVFCGWRIQTLIQLNGWTIGGTMIQGCWRICFVFVLGLFCCFARYCKGILVNWFMWWSAILIAQWRLFMSYVNPDSAKRLAGKFMGSEGTRIGGVYMMLVEESRRKRNFFGGKKKLQYFQNNQKMCSWFGFSDGN